MSFSLDAVGRGRGDSTHTEPWSLPPALITRLTLGVLAIGFILRVLAVSWPADYHMLNSWHESDYTQIARAFYREGMNIFYPRVDWRGDTPGFVEMEFPVIPWIAACLYKVSGYHEQFLRILSALASIGALLAFRRVAVKLLPPTGALLATALFALNGLLVSLAWSIQPESLLLLLTVPAVGAMLRWYEEPSPRRLLAACGLLSAAILVKAPAAHIGFLMAFLVLSKRKVAAFHDPYIYVGALIALLPGIAWYSWAHHLYSVTGLSMGVSNETHFLNQGVILHPFPFILGNGFFELRDSFSFIGIVLCVGILYVRGFAKKVALAWYGSTVLFYFIIADTSGDGWAYYYHCISVAPSALLISVGALALAARFDTIVKFAAGATLFVSLACVYSYREKIPTRAEASLYNCTQQFRQFVPANERIVVRGGKRYDVHGHPVAFNASEAFAWMDRKGINYAEEDLSVERLRQIEQGAERYWIARPSELTDPEIRSVADSQFTVVSKCEGNILYDVHVHPVNGDADTSRSKQ